MKKLISGSAIAIGLLVTGAGPFSAASMPAGVQSVSPNNLSSTDIETVLLAVQQHRTSLLESQLKAQIEVVEQRNQLIANLNAQINQLIDEKAATSDEGKKAKLDEEIQTLKSQIDATSNSQQMDMLRLQSLTNKRNEAFDAMTNFVKKMQDSRSSIIGNMR